MSVHVLSWVLRHSPAEGSDRLVLIVLADKANDDGTGAYPSIETIGREARIRSRTTIRDALRRLQDSGQIVDEGLSEWRTRRWRIVLSPERGGQNLTGQKLTGQTAGPNPSLETSSERSPRSGEERSTEDGSDGSGPDPVRPPTLDEALTALEGEDPAEVQLALEMLRMGRHRVTIDAIRRRLDTTGRSRAAKRREGERAA